MLNTTGFFETVENIFTDWHYDHPRVLYSLIRSLKPKNVVEVGTYRGYGACYMARALQENNEGVLWCIDNFSLLDHVQRHGNARQHLRDNLTKCGVLDWVRILDGDSRQVLWPANVDFAYIDGWHSYDVAKHDFQQCLKRGATCVAFDDTANCVGPKLLFQELRDIYSKDGWDFLHLSSDNGLGIMLRRTPSRPLTFSQEIPYPHPGTDITLYNEQQLQEHFSEAKRYGSTAEYSAILDQKRRKT